MVTASSMVSRVPWFNKACLFVNVAPHINMAELTICFFVKSLIVTLKVMCTLEYIKTTCKNKPMKVSLFYIFCWVLRRTNTASVIWQLFSLIDGGRPQVSLFLLFQAQAGTWVETSTFRKLAGQLSNLKESEDACATRTYDEWDDLYFLTSQFAKELKCKIK
jgi:hypothetical protein